jgi:hypothetical protein
LAIIGIRSTQAADVFQDQDDIGVGENQEDEGEAMRSFFCENLEVDHPVGSGLAERYGVPYADIMEAFCAGSGFGTIGLALETAVSTGENWQELLVSSEEKGWGRIWQDLNLIGRPEHAGPPNDEDGDGHPDFAGPPEDNDGDGRPDFAGPPVDKDGDGRPDFAGPKNDADGDGRPDKPGKPDKPDKREKPDKSDDDEP